MPNLNSYPNRPLSELLATLPVNDRAPFLDSLVRAAQMPDLVAQFDRLTGSNLSRRGTPIERLVDVASGRVDAELRLFCEFILGVMWQRLPTDVRQAAAPSGVCP
ncbi:hypothetical protein ACQHIH_21370 (plasmid) [Xanthomonas sontii]|uniref:hypothetical protein n=1 Tax=Xanthomonas sontii TaxID=2650745 RepID=UPI003F879835